MASQDIQAAIERAKAVAAKLSRQIPSTGAAKRQSDSGGKIPSSVKQPYIPIQITNFILFFSLKDENSPKKMALVSDGKFF